MRSKIMLGPMAEDPTYMAPRWPGTNLPATEPLPPGATVATNIELTDKWDAAKAVDVIATIGKAEQFLSSADIIKPSGINFAEVGATISLFAGIGSFIPGVGTVVGAAAGLVYSVVSWFIGRNDQPQGPILQELANSPDAVQYWAVSYAQIDFIDWAVANGYNNFQTIPEIAKMQLTYWLDRYGWIICWSNAKFYNGIRDAVFIDSAGGEEAVAAMYKQLMADYWATKSARDAAGLLNVNDGYTINAVYKAFVTLPGEDGHEDPDTDEESNTGAVVLLGAVAAGALLIAAKQNS